ncbi:MAG: hypothetical protein ACLR56_05610 [Oscillospiraceae bacterium]
MFENGYTGCNGRHSGQAGRGYLCRQICENSRHKISADSAVGKGLTFLWMLQKERPLNSVKPMIVPFD